MIRSKNAEERKRNPKFNIRNICAAVFCSACVICFVFVTAPKAETTYLITDGDNVITVTSESTDTSDVLEEAGITIDYDDEVTKSDSDGYVSVDILRSCTVTVDYDGHISVLSIRDCTVQDVLDRLGIEYDEDDNLNVQLTDKVFDGMYIDFTGVDVGYKTLEVALPYDINYVANSSMEEGTQKVVTEGKEGCREITYKSTYVGGVLESFSETDSRVVKEPTNEVIEYGTKAKTKPATTSKTSNNSSSKNNSNKSSSSSASVGSNTITIGGKTYTYSSVLNCTASAYTTENQTNKLTASGAVAQVGIIAADTSILPMGTKVYIASAYGSWVYGIATVGDTGGSIKGNKIDLFFNTYDECIQFGIRDAVVYVLS